MTDYDLMVASLRAAERRSRPARAARQPHPAGLAVWVLALAVGVACLAVYLSAPSPAVRHVAPARCTLSAPCYAGHQGGKLIGAYVIVRTARGLVRMPLRAAVLYYRMRMISGPVYLNLPSWGGGD